MKSSIVELMMDTIHSYESKGFSLSSIQVSKDLYLLLKDDMNHIGNCDINRKSLRLLGIMIEPNDYLVGFNMKVFEYTEKEIKEN